MFYAFRSADNEEIKIYVTAADSYTEFNSLKEIIKISKSADFPKSWERSYITKAIDALIDDELKELDQGAIRLVFEEEKNLTSFIEEYNVHMLRNRMVGVERQKEMMYKNELQNDLNSSDFFAKANQEKTIGQIIAETGRETISAPELTEEQKKRQKQELDELRKKGILTNDSWSNGENNGNTKTVRTYRPILEVIKQEEHHPSLVGHWATIYDIFKENENVLAEEVLEAIEKSGFKGVEDEEETLDIVDGALKTIKEAIKKGLMRTTDIKIETDADGNVTSVKAIVHKHEGEIDEDLKAEREAEEARKLEELRAKGGVTIEDLEKVWSQDDTNVAVGIPIMPKIKIEGKKRDVNKVNGDQPEDTSTEGKTVVTRILNARKKAQNVVEEVTEETTNEENEATENATVVSIEPEKILDDSKVTETPVLTGVFEGDEDEDEDEDEGLIAEEVHSHVRMPLELRERIDASRGIFKDMDVGSEDRDEIEVTLLPLNIRNRLAEVAPFKVERIGIIRYTMNSVVDGNFILPYDKDTTVETFFFDVRGKVTLGTTGTIIGKPNKTFGYALYYGNGKDGWSAHIIKLAR